MPRAKPAITELTRLYFEEKVSTEALGKRFGFNGRTIRMWFEEAGVKLLGPAHLRKGIPAHWAVGRKHSPERREKNRAAHLGRRPSNYGMGRVKFECRSCGVAVFDKPYRRKWTCSAACRNHMMRVLRGEKHWNYKGGDLASDQRRRAWADCRDWRNAVLRRCKKTCVRCGVRRKRITAHHLYTWSGHPELRFEPMNGVALCWPCHQAFHSEVPRREATPETFRAWLSASHHVESAALTHVEGAVHTYQNDPS